MSTVNSGLDIIKDGLVFYLDSANVKSYNMGSAWYDISRGGYSGSISGASFSNRSILFDGVNDYISTNYNVNLTDFTVCIWFKPTDSSNTGAARLIDKNYITGFWLGKENDGLPNMWGGGVLESSYPYGRYISLMDGEWNFLTSTRAGVTHSLYGNGIDNTVSGVVSSSPLNTENMFLSSINNITTSFHFKGYISQVFIYNRSLSPIQILQNYNSTKSRYV